MSEETCLVAMRVTSLDPRNRLPGAEAICVVCNAKVWVSASSPPTDIIWCERCALDLIESGRDIMAPTERQISAIVAHLRRSKH
jgi:hypothetical protein